MHQTTSIDSVTWLVLDDSIEIYYVGLLKTHMKGALLVMYDIVSAAKFYRAALQNMLP